MRRRSSLGAPRDSDELDEIRRPQRGWRALVLCSVSGEFRFTRNECGGTKEATRAQGLRLSLTEWVSASYFRGNCIVEYKPARPAFTFVSRLGTFKTITDFSVTHIIVSRQVLTPGHRLTQIQFVDQAEPPHAPEVEAAIMSGFVVRGSRHGPWPLHLFLGSFFSVVRRFC